MHPLDPHERVRREVAREMLRSRALRVGLVVGYVALLVLAVLFGGGGDSSCFPDPDGLVSVDC